MSGTRQILVWTQGKLASAPFKEPPFQSQTAPAISMSLPSIHSLKTALCLLSHLTAETALIKSTMDLAINPTGVFQSPYNLMP